jgi:hypothetical protein
MREEYFSNVEKNAMERNFNVTPHLFASFGWLV